MRVGSIHALLTEMKNAIDNFLGYIVLALVISALVKYNKLQDEKLKASVKESVASPKPNLRKKADGTVSTSN